MKKLLFLLFISLQLSAQDVVFFNNDSINAIDSENRKTGFWKLYDLKRNITVSGLVEDNERFAEVSYFIEGKIFATQKQDSVIIFYIDGKRVHTTLNRKNRSIPIITQNGEPLDRETVQKFFKSAEVPAMYYGGTPAMVRYIINNRRPEFRMHGGRISVEVTIDRDGRVADASIKKTNNYALNDEALRLVRNMPRWQPGFQQGHFVRTRYVIPIDFNFER